jgi:GTPase SAR1 family protein
MKEPIVVSRKVAVLGFRAVGKSALTNSFVTGSFSSDYDPTIESTYHKTIRFRKVHFATDIIDTAGMVSILLEEIHEIKFPLVDTKICCYFTFKTKNTSRMNILVFREMLHLESMVICLSLALFRDSRST